MLALLGRSLSPFVTVPSMTSGQDYALQDQGAAPGPAPVTAEELEAIMKGGGQQPKPRRKKQKTEPASAASVRQGPKQPSPSLDVPPVTAQQQAGTAAVAVPVNSQQQPAAEGRDHPLGAGLFAASLGAGQPAAALQSGQSSRPPDHDSSLAAPARVPIHTGRRQTPEPPAGSHALEAEHQARAQLNTRGDQQTQAAAAAASRTDTTSAMPPPRGSGRSGQGYSVQHAGAGPSAAAPAVWGQGQDHHNLAAMQHVAGGSSQAHPQAGTSGRPPAMPAESQGGSMASDSAWGTEEERMQRKLQRQAEKQRMK